MPTKSDIIAALKIPFASVIGILNRGRTQTMLLLTDPATGDQVPAFTDSFNGTTSVDFTVTNGKLDTIGTYLDGVEGLLGTTNTNTAGIIAATNAVNTAVGVMSGKLPTTLGQTTRALSLSTAPASDYVPPLSPLQAQESRPAPDGVNNYVTAKTGGAVALSTLGVTGLKTICLINTGSGTVYFRLGTSSVTANTPSSTVDVVDGTAPRVLTAALTVLVSVGTATHIALNGTGISLEGWAS